MRNLTSYGGTGTTITSITILPGEPFSSPEEASPFYSGPSAPPIPENLLAKSFEPSAPPLPIQRKVYKSLWKQKVEPTLYTQLTEAVTEAMSPVVKQVYSVAARLLDYLPIGRNPSIIS